MNKLVSSILIFLILFIAGCTTNQTNHEQQSIDRECKIPSDAIKMTPQNDVYPPQLHFDEWMDPVPMSYPITTAGAEDSAFIMPDGKTLYFFFTPDVCVPVEQQLLDGVTGIYVATKQNGTWGKPERVVLQDPGKLALDGAEFVQGNIIWFASAREGYTGVNIFTAEFLNGKWMHWQYAGDTLNKIYQVGELHISVDGSELYFHSNRSGGKGQLDIWISNNIDGVWQEPVNIEAVNTAENEGWPFLTQNGNELWYTRTYLGSPAIFCSEKVNGIWQEPQLVLSQFAGEPSLDDEGNIYFTHHFYNESRMIEADIYVAYRK